MSALSSAELRRRADAVDKLGKSWAVRMEPDEARALADELDQDQEALRMAEEALAVCPIIARPWSAAPISFEAWDEVWQKLDKALAQIRARRKG